MFSLCPHCQFLLARDPRSGRLPATCPKCGGPIVDDDPPAAAAAADGGEPGEGRDAAATQATPEVHHARRPRRRRTGPAADGTADEPDAPRQAATGSPPSAGDPSPGPDTKTDVDPEAKADAGTGEGPGPEPALEPDPPPGPAPDPEAAPGPVQDPDPATPVASPPAQPVQGQPRQAQAGSPDPGPDPPGTAAAAGTDPCPPAAAVPGPAPRPPAARGRRVPSFLQAREPGDRGPRRETKIVWTAIGVLAVVLAVQVLLADRARLAMDAGWRPTLARMCGVLGCTLPPWREPQALTMLSRDVRAHPQRPGTLRVTASFRNDARWPQAWPVLLLTLSDLDGRVAGARAFAPDDYVEADDRDRLLQPGQVATVTLDVVEPSPRIVAFTFDFR